MKRGGCNKTTQVNESPFFAVKSSKENSQKFDTTQIFKSFRVIWKYHVFCSSCCRQIISQHYTAQEVLLFRLLNPCLHRTQTVLPWLSNPSTHPWTILQGDVASNAPMAATVPSTKKPLQVITSSMGNYVKCASVPKATLAYHVYNL